MCVSEKEREDREGLCVCQKEGWGMEKGSVYLREGEKGNVFVREREKKKKERG